MLKKIIAIDSQYGYQVAKAAGFDYFPVEEFRDLVIGGDEHRGHDPNYDVLEAADVIETLYTVIKFPPDDDSAEAVATVATQVERLKFTMEMKGCRVIVCPAKPAPPKPCPHCGKLISQLKHSDDQLLMITTLSACLRLRPDFLVFVAADGDYAPMLWELRNEGIRTEVAAVANTLASDLKRVAFSVIDLDRVFNTIKRGRRQ